MRIALVNGSPKPKNSSSEILLNTLMTKLQDKSIISKHDFRKQSLDNKDLDLIQASDVLVIAFPLYVDGIPAQLLSCLMQMEESFKLNANSNISVYAIVNCGFYEGKQASIALDMIENLCISSGIKYMQGMGIGGGGMLPMLSESTEGKGPWNNLWNSINKFASNILSESSDENIFVSPNIPRFIYKIGGDAGWRRQGKANGLKPKDLFARK